MILTLGRKSPDDLTQREWAWIIASQDNRCRRCGRVFNAALRPTKEHLIPESKGGRLTFKNIAATCQPCNSSRGNRYEPWTVEALYEAEARGLPQCRAGTAPATDKETAMRLDDAFPSKYLRVADIDESLALTIERVELGEFKEEGGTKKKLVIHFREIEKGLVANITNSKTIAGLYGDDTDDWIGRRIVLITMEVPFGSDMVEAIRVSKKQTEALAKKKPAKVAAKAADEAEIVPEDFDDETPF